MQNISRPGLFTSCEIHRNITSFGGECPQCYRDRMNRYSFSLRQRNRALNNNTRQNNINRLNRNSQQLNTNEININLTNTNNNSFDFSNRYQNEEYQNLINQNRNSRYTNIINTNNHSTNIRLPSINISSNPPIQRLSTIENNQQRNNNDYRTPLLLRRQNTQLNTIDIPSISTDTNNIYENDIDEVIRISMENIYPRPRPVSLKILQQKTSVEGYSTTRSGSCVICQNNLEKKDAIRILPCNHTFHIMCIDRWFCERNTCPTCRDELK